MDNGDFQSGTTPSQSGSSHLDSESSEESQQVAFFDHTPFSSQEIQSEPDGNQFGEQWLYSNTEMTFSPGMMLQNLQPGSGQLPHIVPGNGLEMSAIGPVANGLYDDVMLEAPMESQRHAHCDPVSGRDGYDYISSSSSSGFSHWLALGQNALHLNAADGDISMSDLPPIQVVARDPDRKSSLELSDRYVLARLVWGPDHLG
ncbi:hypothetical protein DL771_000411 [Monosporascus sp. 5C6A]|nr:hypothetical protein DL771_000411 [Monosporascus sp. 5C6A]